MRPQATQRAVFLRERNGKQFPNRLSVQSVRRERAMRTCGRNLINHMKKDFKNVAVTFMLIAGVLYGGSFFYGRKVDAEETVFQLAQEKEAQLQEERLVLQKIKVEQERMFALEADRKEEERLRREEEARIALEKTKKNALMAKSAEQAVLAQSKAQADYLREQETLAQKKLEAEVLAQNLADSQAAADALAKKQADAAATATKKSRRSRAS